MLYYYISNRNRFNDALKQKALELNANFSSKDLTLEYVIEIMEFMMECWEYIDKQIKFIKSGPFKLKQDGGYKKKRRCKTKKKRRTRKHKKYSKKNIKSNRKYRKK